VISRREKKKGKRRDNLGRGGGETSRFARRRNGFICEDGIPGIEEGGGGFDLN